MAHFDASPIGKSYTDVPNPLDAVARGLAIFPIPQGCKRPTLRSWPHRCTRDPEVIRAHWRPGDNIGVGCRASGVLGVDLDQHSAEADGIQAFGALCQRHGQPWPDTLTVRTPSGGLHLYFRAPGDRQLGNTQGKLAPGIDTRGPGRGNGGGYLVGPGSIVDGRPYEVVRDVPIAPLPRWLVELLDPPIPRPSTATQGAAPMVADRYARAALQGEIDRLLAAAPGQRNAELNRAAFVLGTLVGGGLLGHETAEQALRAAAERIGLMEDRNCGPRQAAATIRSGLTAGMSRPRGRAAGGAR